MTQGPIPAPTPEQEKRLASLVGLPFVCLSLNLDYQRKVVGNLIDGTPIRVNYVENLWNGALAIDAIEGPGAWRRTMAGPGELQVLAVAERLFGVTIEMALPVYLAMPKTQYGGWDQRPRALWPRPAVN